MVKIKKIIMVALLLVIGPFTFVSNVQAANQYGYPEAIYNGSMSRWEADLSQSSLYEGTQDMQFYNYPYWSQDPVAKNMIYNTRSFTAGLGGYNSVGIQYPSDNGSWRAVYLLYVGPVKVQYLEVGTNNVLLPVNYVAGEGGGTYNIQAEQIPGYQLDHVQGSESGTFNFLGADYGAAGNPNVSSYVTYFYKKVAVGANVTVTYVDELGNEVSAPETLTGNVGDSYTSTQKTISGYTFKEVQGSVNGTFTDSPQTVTYVYTKDKVAGANVTVKYVDESGNEVSAPETLTGNVGDSYTSTQKTISGYTFKEVQGSVNGTFTDSPQTVTYVYTKDKVAGANVTVKYVDESGNEVSAPETLTGNVGDSYTSTQKTVSGYTFKEVQGSATGTFTDSPQTVTYVYTKDKVAGANVTVKYVDESGNEVSAPETLTGNVGDSYTSTQKTVSGYTFKEVQGSATGTFTDSPQTVTYVYTKDKVAGANITVKYVDESGNEVSSPETLTGNVGDSYTSTQKTVSGYTFKEVQGLATGTFTDSPQTVTYVYTKDEVIVPTINVDNTNKIIKNYQSINYSSSLKQINKNYSSEKSILPETGEDKNISVFMIITGLALMSGASMLLMNRFRKNK